MVTHNPGNQKRLYSRNQPTIGSTIFDNASNQIAYVSPLGIYQTIIRDIASRIIGNQNGLSQIYSSVLDAAGRTIATVSPMGFRSSVVWDANSQRVAAINPLGNAVSSVWAANGQLIATQNELGALTSFILDAASQRVCVVDANNGRSTVGWDVRGLKSFEQSQLGELTSFTHDPNSNTILRVDARNWPTSYTIDALNRTAQIQYIDNTRVTNSWDAAGQQIVSADVTGITSTVWDLDSRKTAVQNPTGINLTSTLDVLGNRLVLADPWGLTTNTWDIQSRLIATVSPPNAIFPAGLSVSITWDPLDRESVRYISGLSTSVSHTYDPDGRETAVKTNFFMAPSFTNYYNANNERIGVVESTGGSVSYAYDAASQLINETRVGTDAFSTTYTLDLLGNRLLQEVNGVITTRTFNSANAQLTSTPASGPPTTSAYDPNGNLIQENTGGSLVSMTWDPENRLLSNASASGTESYLYSQDGYRKKKTKSSGTTLFTWDEDNNFIETDASLNFQARRTDYPGYWGGLSSQVIDGYANLLLFDSQGTTRFAYWFIGQSFFASAYILDAFGNLLSIPPSQPNPMQFVGQFGYYSDGTGLINLRDRYYDPVNGRFISRDRIGFEGGVNPYQYGDNNPAVLSDASGLQVSRPQKRKSTKPEYPDQKSCADMMQCLNADKGYNCSPTADCPAKPIPISKELAICVMYYESKLSPNHGPSDNGGGVGQLTCIAVEGLTRANCNRDICCIMGSVLNAGLGGWCDGAQASYMWMQCKGLQYPGGYGNSTYAGEQQKRFRDCEACIKANKPCSGKGGCLHLALPKSQR